ncbi:DUF2235 domain-containing protein [Demequina lignilytica]|uniref:DUF2235 domain-containing protein n=1 Tax=Demequina lignilytica TaxID=3051663 RepID=A0AB35MEM9_9MICO|nr:DUF2235 domain-containing protein [Demequina sp. SYSU T0a273]MDN4482226.1 DUF2235 domain-containing protein [Demequina sp. SYSU T0a273]
MVSRIVLCCDGTWSRPDQAADGTPTPTNVTKLAAAIAPTGDDGARQAVLYHRGVGTDAGERLLGAAFGVGLSRIVRDAYRDIVAEYTPGDELYLIGFSRGAYTARSVAGLIRNCGILRPEHRDRLDDAYRLYRSRAYGPHAVESELFRRSYSHPDVGVRFIGVWDTVGALGLPWSGIPGVRRLNRRWSFHDTRLSGTVQAAFHALSIDEQRKPYAPAVWELPDPEDAQIVEQVWFAGDHSKVGGGVLAHGLSDITLRWMADRVVEHGLTLRPGSFAVGDDAVAGDDELVPFAPDPRGEVGDARTGLFRLWPPHVRPLGAAEGGRESVAATAVDRLAVDPAYRPRNLEGFLEDGGPVSDV